MHPKHIWIALLFVITAFAGCSDGGGVDPDSSIPPVTVDPKKGLGAIVGVVVDGTITPVSGATVALAGQDASTETDENGAFSFTDLEPGPYFVTATKPGYSEVQQSVEVIADEKKPPVVKMLLEADPETRPYYSVFSFEGFMECAVGVMETPVTVGSSAVNVCAAAQNFGVPSNSVSPEPYEIEAGPTLIQSEMIWDSTSSADSLQVSHAAPDAAHTDGWNDFDTAEGMSPLVVQSNGTVADEAGVGTEYPLTLRVFPAGGDAVTVHQNRQYQVITHVFYNFTPPEGWTFIEDGEPQVPE